jgi:hypothetical protein
MSRPSLNRIEEHSAGVKCINGRRLDPAGDDNEIRRRLGINLVRIQTSNLIMGGQSRSIADCIVILYGLQ